MSCNIGYLYLLITFLGWGSIYIVSKYALAVMGPVTVSFCRYAVSVICLYGIMRVKGVQKKVAKEHWKYFWILGGLGYFGAIILQLGGTALLSGSLASLINSMNPIVISLMAAVFLKEKITWKNVVSIMVSLIGVYIILGKGAVQINPVGIALSGSAVILWSAASVTIRKISGYYDPIQTALYGMSIALVLNAPAAVLENLFMTRSHPTPTAIFACLFVAVIGTAVSHTCWNKSLQLIDASTCSMFYPLQPLVSAVLGVVLLHEVITWQFVLGAIFICSGIVITFLPLNFKFVSNTPYGTQ